MSICEGNPLLVKIGCFVSMVNLIIYLIGILTPSWYQVGEGHMGLFAVCGNTSSISSLVVAAENSAYVFVGRPKRTNYYGYAENPVQCFRITKDGIKLPDNMKNAATLGFLACVAFLGALVCAVLKALVKEDNRPINILCVATNLVAGLCGLIGVIVFATMKRIYFEKNQDEIVLYATSKIDPEEMKLDASKLSVSFAFCAIASIGGLLNVVMYFLNWIRTIATSRPIPSISGYRLTENIAIGMRIHPRS